MGKPTSIEAIQKEFKEKLAKLQEECTHPAVIHREYFICGVCGKQITEAEIGKPVIKDV